MGYLSDFRFYNSGTECPTPYLDWAALSLLGAVLGRKVWAVHGDQFPVLPLLYTTLVGTAGSGKSTAKNFAKQLCVEAFPEIITSASIQSHQDIIDVMANAGSAHTITWKDELGELGEAGQIYKYVPFYIIANEFASLLQTDKRGMTDFLVDIYDEAVFSTGFKGRRLDNAERSQDISNPFLPMLACAVPTWFMYNLKMDLFEGGLGRRLIIVYSKNDACQPDPFVPVGGAEAKERIKVHLKEARYVQGRVRRTEMAGKWWREWYVKNKKFERTVDDPILKQFASTKHMQLYKVALILAMTERPFKMVIEDAHYEMARIMLDALEPSIVQLTGGIGRNELAGIAQSILDCLAAENGFAELKRFQSKFFREVRYAEWMEIVNTLEQTDKIKLARFKPPGLPERDFIFLANRYAELTSRPAGQSPVLESSVPDSVPEPNGRPAASAILPALPTPPVGPSSSGPRTP